MLSELCLHTDAAWTGRINIPNSLRAQAGIPNEPRKCFVINKNPAIDHSKLDDFAPNTTVFTREVGLTRALPLCNYSL